MKFIINSESEFYVTFPEEVDNIIGLDAKCYWVNSKNRKYILVSSVFDVLISLKYAIEEVISGARELSDKKKIGNLGKNYNESNQMFLTQIKYGEANLPKESKFEIWLGNDVLTFMYSYEKKIYIEVSPGYPYSYTDEKIIDFPAWMIGFKSLSLAQIKKYDLENWLTKIDSILDKIA